MYIRWVPMRANNVILIPPKTRERLNINYDSITLHIGAWEKRLRVILDNRLDDDFIGLPERLCAAYSIPHTLPYDVYVQGQDVFFGPVIAFFVGNGFLSKEKRGKWESYCMNYPQIRGLVYFCTEEGVDIVTKTIKGYYYNPDCKPGNKLKSGAFPYPGVVYRRARIKQRILRDLKKHVGPKIFNAKIFNKWEMWEVLVRAGFKNTPYTAKLSGIDSLKKMLDCYESVYLKPATGRFGNGVQRIEKTPDGCLFRGKYGTKQPVKDFEALFKLVRIYKNRNYIIQQAIPIEYQGTPVDFRVVLQKDRTQKWACSGIMARIGKKGRIITNNAASVESGYQVLRKIYGLTSTEASEKINEIIRICTRACLIIERAYGNYGDVGIDVLVDPNLKVWVLEINKSHQHKMAMFQTDDPLLYERVISRPLEYAKKLAGF